MDGITITITGATGVQARELMAELLGIAAVAQPEQKADAPEAGNEGTAVPVTRTAEAAPVKRNRAAKPKPEAVVAEKTEEVPAAEEESAVTKEDFLAKLNGLRATWGDGIIPDLRKILADYKTDTGEVVVQSSQVQTQDFPKIMQAFAALEEKKKSNII